MEDTPEAKARILKVARELFIKNGYKGTSVRDIATASETNVAMVNYYYRSKYNLFEIIFEESLDILSQRIFQTIYSDLSFFELIESWIHSYYEILAEHPHISIFILNEISLDPQRLTKRIRNRRPYEAFVRISNLMNNEIQKGTIRQTPSADFLLNVLSLCMYPFMFGPLAMSLMDISQDQYTNLIEKHKVYVVEFIFNALRQED